MARIRSIKPEYAKSHDVAKCSLAARYFFSVLWCELDDKGRILYTPKRLSGELFPHDDGSEGHTLVDAKDVAGWVRECCDAGLLLHYKVGSTEYLWVVKFLIHQKIERPSPSRLPSPFDESAEVIRGIRPDDSAIREGQFDESGGEIHRKSQQDSPNTNGKITEASPKKRKNSEPPARDQDLGPRIVGSGTVDRRIGEGDPGEYGDLTTSEARGQTASADAPASRVETSQPEADRKPAPKNGRKPKPAASPSDAVVIPLAALRTPEEESELEKVRAESRRRMEANGLKPKAKPAEPIPPPPAAQTDGRTAMELQQIQDDLRKRKLAESIEPESDPIIATEDEE